MASAGAKGKTLQQMVDVLHLPKDGHAGFKQILKQLTSAKSLELNIVNRLWGKKGQTYHRAFQDLLQENYAADLFPLNYAAAPEAARETINQWVSQATKNKINDLLPAGSISRESDLVITNAIYFKGDWLSPFEEKWTKTDDFHVAPSKKAPTKFMTKTDSFRYAENSQVQLVELPYVGGELVFVALLPREGQTLETVKNKITPQVVSELKPAEVEVVVPKFKLETFLDMGDILQQMGMKLAFDANQADFTGMRKAGPNEARQYISKVVHKAFVEVSEKGTEAAAATSILVPMGGAPPASAKVFKANRPFLFFIRHTTSGAILFMGRYARP